MKSILCTIVAVALTASAADANGKGGAPNRGPIQNTGAQKALPAQGTFKTPIVDKQVGKTPIVDMQVGKLGSINQKFPPTGVATPIKPGVQVGKVGSVNPKVQILGNKSVAKLPGFKSDPKVHLQYCGQYNLPGHLHNHCFFQHDFCWNHHCWFPSFGCCGYWHPHACCWYYWYEPYCCYLPCSYIEMYTPMVVVQQAAPVVVNVTNTNTNIDSDVPPMLPPGAASTLPPSVNPMILAPKQ